MIKKICVVRLNQQRIYDEVVLVTLETRDFPCQYKIPDKVKGKLIPGIQHSLEIYSIILIPGININTNMVVPIT